MIVTVVVQMIIFTTSSILHMIGLFLLYNQSINISKTQKILILNLSITEILLGCWITSIKAQLYLYGENVSFKITKTIYFSVILSYYCTIISLTLDRLGQVYFNIRYSLLWNAKRTKYLTLIVWVAIVIIVVICATYLLQNIDRNYHKIENVFISIIYPAFSIIFVFVVVPTYTYVIILLLRQEREKVQTDRRNDITHPSSRPVIKLDHILLPLLLMVAFVLFLIVPHVILSLIFKNVIKIQASRTLLEICRIMFGVGFTSDAFIYVLFSTATGKDFLRRIKLSGRGKGKKRGKINVQGFSLTNC